jgi:hypothetical protein
MGGASRIRYDNIRVGLYTLLFNEDIGFRK